MTQRIMNRRTFLSHTAIAAALESLLQAIEPAQESSPRHIRPAGKRRRLLLLTAVVTLFIAMFIAVFVAGVMLFLEMGNGTIRGIGNVVAFDPDTSQRAVELWISGNDIPIVHQGDHVRLHFESWPAVRSDGAFGGEVMTIDPTADTAGNFQILIKPDGKDSWPDERYLRPGVRANCWVFTGSRSDTKSGGN